jgi:hypothetical protein
MNEFPYLSMVAASEISEEDKQSFKLLSDKAIKFGFVERLSNEGILQAIENIAYEIAKMSLYTFFKNPDVAEFTTPEEFYEDEVIGEDLEKLDEIIWNVALASGIHPDLLNVMIDVKCDEFI